MQTELYQVDVYDPTRDVGRDQYLFYFHFAPQRWSSDQARRMAWWIASNLFEADESIVPGCTKGMLVYTNLIIEDVHALPRRAYSAGEGITVWIALSPVFSQLRNEITTGFRLQMVAAQIQSQLQAAR
jgi:hypothetical protein